MKPKISISPEARKAIGDAQSRYQEMCENLYSEMVYELSMRLGLEYDLVERVLDEEF